jgi:hypothetical protein
LNLRRRQPTDLQSAPFGHSGTPPRVGRKNYYILYYYIVSTVFFLCFIEIYCMQNHTMEYNLLIYERKSHLGLFKNNDVVFLTGISKSFAIGLPEYLR